MPVMIRDGKVLIRDGAVAMNSGCCCGGTCSSCNAGTVPQYLFFCLESSEGPSATCAAVNGLWKLSRNAGGGDYLPEGVSSQCSWYQARGGFGWLAWKGDDSKWHLRGVDLGADKICAEYETNYDQVAYTGNCCGGDLPGYSLDAPIGFTLIGGPAYDAEAMDYVCPNCATPLPPSYAVPLPSSVVLYPRGGSCPEACNPDLYTLNPVWQLAAPGYFTLPFPYSNDGPPMEEGGGPTCEMFGFPPDFFGFRIGPCTFRTHVQCNDLGPEPCDGPAMYGEAQIVGGALVVKYYARKTDADPWTHFVTYEGPFDDPDNYCARPDYHGTPYTNWFTLTRTFNLWTRDEYGTPVPCTPETLQCEASACNSCEW